MTALGTARGRRSPAPATLRSPAGEAEGPEDNDLGGVQAPGPGGATRLRLRRPGCSTTGPDGRAMSRPRHPARAGAVAAVLVAVVVGTSVPAAWAAFAGQATASATYSSATLAPPTGLSATASCSLLIVGPQVALGWTATTSTYATGYTVERSTASGGPYTVLASLGASTTSYTDTSTSAGTTYWYVVVATYQSWSTPSAQASATTPSLCL